MTTDPELEALGEEFHTQVMETYGLETEAWAHERLARVSERLQPRPETRLIPEVIWVDVMTAFILPGRYLYFTRELLQMMATDDAAAFVMAHEIAHHRLGHLDVFRGKKALLRRVPAGVSLALILHAAGRLLIGPEAEAAADLHALALCLAAGYDGAKCLEVFDILEKYALDLGALESVFGPWEDLLRASKGRQSWADKTAAWLRQRKSGYFPIRDRKETLENVLRQMAS